VVGRADEVVERNVDIRLRLLTNKDAAQMSAFPPLLSA
jgi:hypothetical protein